MRRTQVAISVLSDDACHQLWGTGTRAPVHFQQFIFFQITLELHKLYNSDFVRLPLQTL